jgi:tetratricopeptide (TPR) repeat protein
MGKVLADQGRYADAVSWLERATAMSPDRFTLSVFAHTLVAGEIDRDRGVELATRVTNLTPAPFGPPETMPFWPPPEETLGLAAIQREQYAEAVGWLETAAEKNPNRSEIRKALDLTRSKATGMP